MTAKTSSNSANSPKEEPKTSAKNPQQTGEKSKAGSSTSSVESIQKATVGAKAGSTIITKIGTTQKSNGTSGSSEIPLLYAITLSDNGSPQDKKAYIRIPLSEKVTILRFILKAGTLAAGGHPTLCTNYPIKGVFDRHSFHSIPFVTDEKLLGAYCDVEFANPGVYEYRVEYTNDAKKNVSQSGFIVAEPRLTIETNKGKQPLPLDALMALSVVPKWMGPVTEWKEQLDMIHGEGYNMIHFVPMQKRGSSDSPYSISNQLAFSDDLFDSKDAKKSDKEKLIIIQNTLKRIQKEYGILCLSDVVWNHTSDTSPFLLEHPEAGYNLHNSPHIVPAYELDTAFVELSGNMEQAGLPRNITSQGDVDLIMDYAAKHTIPALKLYEYLVINVAEQKKAFKKALVDRIKCDPRKYFERRDLGHLSLKEKAIILSEDAVKIGNPGKRFNKSVDLSHAVAFVLALSGIHTIDAVGGQEDKLVDDFGHILDEYNLPLYKTYDDNVSAAISNIKSRLSYTRLDQNGPKFGEITKCSPIVESYFTRLHDKGNKHPPGSMALANNGWIWNADPMNDFAGPNSQAYLRREVIIWGDCVKLRYGKSPKDNPWLWEHMRAYTEQVASMFQGIRIDNCHSTPIPVAEYLLDTARKVQPNLYVLAELFTGSPDTDNLFVSRLGIHSLVREAMQAWDTHELSRLVHRHGGKPVGSMDEDMTWKRVPYEGEEYDNVYYIPVSHGSMPRALFMDCTHDNETPFQKRLAQDTLPNAAIVAFSDCATGSVKGYDEIYPRLLDIVGEHRLYTKNTKSAGIVDVKSKLQKLHLDMSIQGYTEVHVHQENDYLLVHRQSPGSQEGYLLIARTAFPNSSTGISPIKLRKTQTTFVLGASLKIDGDKVVDDTKLSGLPSHIENLPSPGLEHHEDDKGSYTQVVLPESFAPGSIYVLKTSIGDVYKHAREIITTMDDAVLKDFDLLDCNVALYRCEGEEMDATGGDGVYNVSDYGKFVYAGLQGFMSALTPIIINNDLGHPVCNNLREGKWMLEYVVNRLVRQQKQYPHLKTLSDWFDSRFDVVKQMPDFLVPKYFAMTIQTAYDNVYAHALSRMSPLIQNGDQFLKQLALCSVQMYGQVPSTGLHPTKSGPCLAAGLPHFTTGAFRTWGRDVFISLRGLLLVTGQFGAAKEHIVAFGSSLKHGLIPNLLDAVRVPRYNARDAAWFFMQAIQDYYNMAPDGPSILTTKVLRRFPKDDHFVPVEEGYQYSSTIGEIMQEILQRHAQGIHFREYNAGEAIDRQMKDQGFNIDIDVDWETGVLVGGNEFNCGTWMDKMGESEKAHNKGFPGTPRDGAPIEITGLLKSALRFVLELHKKKEFEWSGAQVKDKTVSYQHWNDLLQKNFERIYYVPKDPSEDKAYDVDPRIVHRRGIYKDVWKATKPYTEYQLRCNFPVAMTVAPELFNKEHAAECLRFTKDILVGPLGMSTLDPADREYHPYYYNSDDSDDFLVAKGRNYHQGPEWIWPLGYYLRAVYIFNAMPPQSIARILRAHREEIVTNPWRGLAELTNKNGEKCWDSCDTQAWSASTLLDLLQGMIEGV
ncbi:glycogen debranching enzyme [Phycomyces nitens]|nr:glycogen debranching enzyme [Phycomyces nitens]